MDKPEQNEVTETESSPLNTVTPFSKYLAMVLFLALPFIGGWVGYTYTPEKIVEVEKIIKVKEESTPNVSSNINIITLVELLKLRSATESTLTLVANNDSVDRRLSRNGKEHLDISECDAQFIPEDFLYDGYMNDYQHYNGCQINISTPNKRLTYRERELMRMGGKPQFWIDDTHLATFIAASDGMNMPIFGLAGIFDVENESFQETVQVETPGNYWKRMFITYADKRYIVVSIDDTETGRAHYNLYTVKTSRDFYDFFLPNTSWSADYTPTDGTLDSSKINELELIGMFKETFDSPQEIVADMDNNLIFTFGVTEGSKDYYIFDTSEQILERVENISGA